MTPSKTPFAGIERLAPGDPLSSDGYAFQDIDRLTIDRLLRLGAVTHLHDAHAALANPALAPTMSFTTGGTIDAATPVYVTYTLLDAYGGETLPVDAVSLTTPAGYQDPIDAPTVTISYAAGTLQAGDFSYAITVSDGLGGETAIGPSALAEINPGFPNAEVTLSGLVAAMNDASGSDPGASWRLWRSNSGGPWYLVGTGTADTFLDDGVAGDCTVAPPLFGTTKGTNALRVTVPGGQPAGTQSFSIYASLDGTFTSPAFLANLLPAQLGVVQTFNSLTPLDGSPPTVTRSYPGAAQIDAVTEIVNFNRAVGIIPATQQGAAYTFQQADVGTVVEYTGASAAGLTVPPHSSVPFPVGAVIEVFQVGAGQVTILAGAGVTLRSDTGRVRTAAQYSTIGLRQRATDEWVLSGDLA